ncbi:MAG: DNA-processing protein DprA [Nitrospirales bacterium]|nr:DNA-processing protein DprA [Nitrospira sp.]MDR4501042.1 DNA-processing protein DprA [Nitrospirales bacterium]
MNEDLSSWLELRSVKGVGPSTLSRLVLEFGSPRAVQAATATALVEQGGVSLAVAERIHQRPDPQTRLAIDQELQALENHKAISICTILDADYPSRLRTIPDPPPLLYVTGQLEKVDDHAIAVVGSRNATPGGQVFTRALSRELASAGFTVVSGLARGVDQAAHRGALDSSSGRTLAVLGCGIDRTYPMEHKALREHIECRGAIISELSLGAEPHGYHFPQRNRIISGLSLGVVVTEATENSGSLITTRFALEYNREVFAVPGAVTNKMARGAHQLIKQGAKLVESIDDILVEILPLLEKPFVEGVTTRRLTEEQPTCALSEQEQAVYTQISLEPITLEDLLSQDCGLTSEVMGVLLSLEMKGLIQRIAGAQYIRSSVQ